VSFVISHALNLSLPYLSFFKLSLSFVVALVIILITVLSVVIHLVLVYYQFRLISSLVCLIYHRKHPISSLVALKTLSVLSIGVVLQKFSLTSVWII
jgi:hypothetical protein